MRTELGTGVDADHLNANMPIKYEICMPTIIFREMEDILDQVEGILGRGQKVHIIVKEADDTVEKLVDTFVKERAAQFPGQLTIAI